MRIGWIGYNTLRRSLMAPIGAVDQYYTILPALRELSGEPVHWLQIKKLQADAHLPDPFTSEDDEIAVINSVVHYGDCFKPLMQYINGSPPQGRMEYLVENPFDMSQLKYPVPYLDIVIVEATGQMGAAYGVDVVSRELYKVNPNIGFIIFDQDLASPTVKSKQRRWHPGNPDLRQITCTHYTTERYPSQCVALSPHLSYRNRPPILNNQGIAYIGNDYKRREPMLRLMRGNYFHHYGKLKIDFEPEMRNAGVIVHGPVVPTKICPIEDIYRRHGLGMHCLRTDAYRLNLIAVRLSEIARAGCLAFCDRQLAIGQVLSGDWCLVNTAAEAEAKARMLPSSPDFWQDQILYQQNALGYYTSNERYIESIWAACQRLMEGPIYDSWKFNLYQDLMVQSHLTPWG